MRNSCTIPVVIGMTLVLAGAASCWLAWQAANRSMSEYSRDVTASIEKTSRDSRTRLEEPAAFVKRIELAAGGWAIPREAGIAILKSAASTDRYSPRVDDIVKDLDTSSKYVQITADGIKKARENLQLVPASLRPPPQITPWTFLWPLILFLSGMAFVVYGATRARKGVVTTRGAGMGLTEFIPRIRNTLNRLYFAAHENTAADKTSHEFAESILEELADSGLVAVAPSVITFSEQVIAEGFTTVEQLRDRQAIRCIDPAWQLHGKVVAKGRITAAQEHTDQ